MSAIKRQQIGALLLVLPLLLPVPAAAERSAGEAEEALGIRILGVYRSAEGYLLDLRYRVEDAERAAPVLDRRVKPRLVAARDGRELAVPVSAKVGSLRQTTLKPEAGRGYFMLFANPARGIGAEERVTLVIGDRRIENLIVE